MARKTKRRSGSRAAEAGAGSRSNRDKAIASFMSLLAEHRFEQIGLSQIASDAKLSLADLRAEFASTLSILAAHIKEIDREVLAGIDADMAEEPPRERLFDVLMRRLEILEPHKEAVRSLLRSASCNPGFHPASAIHGIVTMAMSANVICSITKRPDARSSAARDEGSSVFIDASSHATRAPGDPAAYDAPDDPSDRRDRHGRHAGRG